LARIRPLFGSLALLLAVLALPTLPASAQAEDLYTYSVAALGGVGGSPDVNSANYGNSGYQINLGLVTEPRTVLGLRVGKLSLDRPAVFGTLTGADLSYATIGGEYRFRESYYDSGVYLALGAYRLSGTDAFGASRDRTAAGASLGFTGEFPITRRLGVLVELSGHYADLRRDGVQFFGMGHAGVIWHF